MITFAPSLPLSLLSCYILDFLPAHGCLLSQDLPSCTISIVNFSLLFFVFSLFSLSFSPRSSKLQFQFPSGALLPHFPSLSLSPSPSLFDWLSNSRHTFRLPSCFAWLILFFFSTLRHFHCCTLRPYLCLVFCGMFFLPPPPSSPSLALFTLLPHFFFAPQ